MKLSILFPVHNEEYLLEKNLPDFWRELEVLGPGIEIIFIENGSQDCTRKIIEKVVQERPGTARLLIQERADYGAAIRAGLLKARGQIRAAIDLDAWDCGFIEKGLRSIAQGADFVIGCKEPSIDGRPWLRRLATRVHLALVSALFPELKGLDSHGPILLKWESCKSLVIDNRFAGDTFKAGLLIAARQARLNIATTPISVRETRPARTPLIKRTPFYFFDLWQLYRQQR